MAESENSFEIQSEQKSDISGGLGTVYRINNSWSWVNLHYRNNDWRMLINELNVIYVNLTGFIKSLDKDGTIEDKPECKKAKELKIKTMQDYIFAMKKDKFGNNKLCVSGTLLNSIEEYDSYLRVVSMKYGLYASMGDDYSNQPLLSREPRWNKKRW